MGRATTGTYVPTIIHTKWNLSCLRTYHNITQATIIQAVFENDHKQTDKGILQPFQSLQILKLPVAKLLREGARSLHAKPKARKPGTSLAFWVLWIPDAMLEPSWTQFFCRLLSLFSCFPLQILHQRQCCAGWWRGCNQGQADTPGVHLHVCRAGQPTACTATSP